MSVLAVVLSGDTTIALLDCEQIILRDPKGIQESEFLGAVDQEYVLVFW